MAKINIDQFAILAEKAPEDGISYSVNFNFKAASNAHRIACGFELEFSDNDAVILKLAISCEFDIHPDDWKNNINQGKLIITKNDLGFLANQTVGTSRGIMFCKTQGTEYWNFILPPINLTEIIDDDFVVDITETPKE